MAPHYVAERGILTFGRRYGGNAYRLSGSGQLEAKAYKRNANLPNELRERLAVIEKQVIELTF